MSISTDLNTIMDNYEQSEIALKYKDLFKKNSKHLTILDSQIQSVVDSTEFDAIPTDTKQALNRYWQLIKDFNVAVTSDIEIQELLTWNKSIKPVPLE
jgi:hypothetical protein